MPDTTSRSDIPTPSEDPGVFLETSFGKAQEVPLDYFTKTVLPPPHPDINLGTRLQKRALRHVVTKEDKWWGYSAKTPSQHLGQDFSKSYVHLERGVRRVVNATRKARPTIMFQVNKKGVPFFEERTSEYLPDAVFLTTPITKNSLRWENVAVVGEFDRSEENDRVLQVAQKIVASMSRCMRTDARRRFIYGFTIENARTRLWYGDRSRLLVTEPFDFITNYRPFLTFVLRISFAKPHQLGWDPTIERIESQGPVQYEITVQPSNGDLLTYRTLAILSDSGVNRLQGRGTRVWKAVRVIDGEDVGAPVALKDAWVDSDREREGDAYRRLVHSEYFVKERPELKECFIAVDVHGDVMNMGSLDCTPCFLAHRPSRLVPSTSTQTHYRIVYAEIGESLRDITSLHFVFRILLDALNGVSAMHAAGWVHRDLSAGNILVVEGKGKIHDLELATDDPSSDKVGRIGTADFIAVEVDEQRYLFAPPPPAPPKSPSPSSSESSFGPPPLLHLMDLMKDPTNTLPELQYNFLHDLESLWWNAVYFTVNRVVEGCADQSLSTSPDQKSAQHLSAGQLFYEKQGRFDVLFDTHGFARHVRHLHPVLSGIPEILEDLRISLRRAYAKAECSITHMDPTIAKQFEDRMRARFQSAAAILDQKNVVIGKFRGGDDD